MTRKKTKEIGTTDSTTLQSLLMMEGDDISGTNDTCATTDTGHLTRLNEPPAKAIRDAKFRPGGMPDPKIRPGRAF